MCPGAIVATDQELSEVLSDFARTMLTDFPIQTILDRLVEQIVEVMPVTGAGVTLISEAGKQPRYVAASNESALRFEKLQTDLAEGPCLAAFHEKSAVAIPELRADRQFDSFSRQGVEAGLEAVFAFPLRHGERDAIGALDLYRDVAGPLSDATMHAAQTLADVAAAYILNAQARIDLEDASARFQEKSLQDSLTGLPNRVLFGQLFDHAVLRTRRSGCQLAILYADLDHFKEVNDVYGHQIGDELLVAVAERLTDLLRPGDTLARLAGDEFVILCEDFEDPSMVEGLADRIDAGMNRPFVLSGHELNVTASVGIAYSGPGEEVPERILRDADTAMYQAKRRGGAGHQVLDLREQARVDDLASMSRDLNGVLTRGELAAYYQPIVEAATGRIVGIEALMRWSHPTRGEIAPTLLIPLAEESRVMADVGRWMLERACRDLKRWNRTSEAAERLRLSINVSPHELLLGDYVPMVTSVLAETRTDPGDVTIEVTEGVLLKDPQRALVILNDLRDIGVTIALDDFGTGYSSLSYLNDFPVDIVKIDLSIVASIGKDTRGMTVLAAIVDLAHALGKTVIAEGLETAAQYSGIAALGCEACQGFYFARPMPARQIDDLLARDGDRCRVQLPVGARG
jgi:diguanylate cyclase (GGDEF)-like protein